MCLAPSLAFARARALARLHLSVVSKPLTNPVCIDTISDNLFSASCTSSLATTCKHRKMSMMAEKGETIVRNMHGQGRGHGQGGEVAKHVRVSQPWGSPPPLDFIPEGDAYRGTRELCERGKRRTSCPTLSSELGLLLLTSQGVRGTAGPGFVIPRIARRSMWTWNWQGTRSRHCIPLLLTAHFITAHYSSSTLEW